MFLSSTTGPFLRPDLPDSTAPRTEAVKIGRRPPPQAAQCGLDGREHGVTLNQVGSARFLSRHPIRKGWLIDLPPARLPPAALFACHNGRKSHQPQVCFLALPALADIAPVVLRHRALQRPL